MARRPAYRGPIERPTWLVPAIIALVVILVLVTVGAIVLHGRGAATGGTAKASPTAKTSPTRSSPTPSPTAVGLLPIPDYGPAVNPPLTSVKFCTPSAPCAFGGGVPPAMDTHCTLGGPCHVDYAATWSGNTVITTTPLGTLVAAKTGESGPGGVGWPKTPALWNSLIVMLRSISSLNSYWMGSAFSPVAFGSTVTSQRRRFCVRGPRR